jgi:predicted ATP-grasp superfamily ATP-dependent carboligase
MKNTKLAPAVVTYMSYAGLGIVRSLGRKGIPVYAVDSDPHKVGMQSKYCTPLICPDINESEEKFIRFIIELGKKFDKKAVLYPTGDKMVLAFSKYREKLTPYYHCLMPDDNLVRFLVSKDGLDEIARKYDIPAPRTAFPENGADIEALSRGFQYPVIIKPSLSHNWHNPEIYKIVGKNNKVAVAYSKEELFSFYNRIAAINKGMIIQELIPGYDDQLYYVCLYCDNNSEPVGIFAGQKIRLFPVHFGSASYVESYYDKKLIALAAKMVKNIGYKGLCGIEFKKDPRDETYKLIEFNVRFGLWDMLGEKCGVDLAYKAYKDAIGQPIKKKWEYKTGIIWLAIRLDFAAFRTYRREGLLSLLQWLKSLIGSKSCAVFAYDDMRPSFSTSYRYWKGKLNLRKT